MGSKNGHNEPPKQEGRVEARPNMLAAPAPVVTDVFGAQTAAGEWRAVVNFESVNGSALYFLGSGHARSLAKSLIAIADELDARGGGVVVAPADALRQLPKFPGQEGR